MCAEPIKPTHSADQNWDVNIGTKPEARDLEESINAAKPKPKTELPGKQADIYISLPANTTIAEKLQMPQGQHFTGRWVKDSEVAKFEELKKDGPLKDFVKINHPSLHPIDTSGAVFYLDTSQNSTEAFYLFLHGATNLDEPGEIKY